LNPSIVHRDLKLENILITNDQIKVADFGQSTEKTKINTQKSCGTKLYLAPEMILKKDYDEKVDV